MLNLGLPDAAAILYLLFSVARADRKGLGDSLHGLIAILLLMALAMGLRLAGELRHLFTNLHDALQLIPGLGSRILIFIAAWYVLRLIRKRLAYWIEQVIPLGHRVAWARLSEATRAMALSLFIAWLVEGWYGSNRAETPALVQLARYLDQLLLGTTAT